MAFPFSGLKKQINKVNQFMSEKTMGVEGTKLDTEFTEMEKRCDLFNEVTEDLQVLTKEMLQPNPTVRAKMAAVKGISKLSGQAKASTYPQPEGTLGDAMCNYGRKWQDFDNASVYAASLVEMGDALKQMADLKYALDDNVKQNFLEPLHHTQTKDLKEVFHHRKKLQGRKLDYDCKKRQGQTEEVVRAAEDKFAESMQNAQVGMHNLLDGSGIEHISQLTQFSEALLEYHKNCTTILQALTDTMYEKTNEASMQPKKDFKPKTLGDLGIDRDNDDGGGGGGLRAPGRNGVRASTSSSNLQPGSSSLISTSPGASPAGTPTHSSNSFGNAWGDAPQQRPASPSMRPSCRALYDFDAENPGELTFKEGDHIILKSKIDDNWYEGSVNGKTGYFPVTYVNVINPLP